MGEKQDNIFISEYSMPDGFIPIAEIQKPVLSSANGSEGYATERLYTNERTWYSLDDDTQRRYELNLSKQITLW